MFVGVNANPDAGPNIFAALQKQLGLKLEAGKDIMKVLVVDSTMPPTEKLTGSLAGAPRLAPAWPSLSGYILQNLKVKRFARLSVYVRSPVTRAPRPSKKPGVLHA